MQRLYIPDFRVNEEIYEMSATFLAYKIYLHCGKTGDYDENLKNIDKNNNHKEVEFDYINKYMYQNTNATSLFGPNFLVKNQSKKREAWNDLLMIKDFLNSN